MEFISLDQGYFLVVSVVFTRYKQLRALCSWLWLNDCFFFYPSVMVLKYIQRGRSKNLVGLPGGTTYFITSRSDCQVVESTHEE